tara:strand:+ start:1364 stop:1801 length:438 start_codon:yes stop_codon:yes gene_type:complete
MKKIIIMTKKVENQMKSEQSSPIKERRKSIDFWFYLARALTICSWLAFIAAIYISYFVAPETDYGVLRYYKIEVRKFWLTPLTGYLYLVIWFSAAGIYAATLIDKYRSRRQDDNTHYNAYFLLGFNLLWLSVILYHVLKTANIIN